MEKAKNVLNYMTCDKGELHDGEKLIFICLDPKCALKLACCICLNEIHNNHKVFPIKILKKISKENLLRLNLNNGQNGEYLNKIETLKQKSLEEFDILSDEVSKNMEKMKSSIEGMYENLKYCILSYSLSPEEIDKNLDNILRDDCDKISIEESIKKLTPLILFQERKDKLSIANDLFEKQIEFVRKKTENNQVIFSKMIFEGFKNREKSLNYNVIENFFKKSYFSTFSNSLHNQNIMINEEKSIALLKSGYYALALTEEPLSKEVKSYFGFKILNNGQNWICLGAAYANKVRNGGFNLNNYSQINHGAYMVTCDNYALSHHEISVNYANFYTNFAFTTGDFVYCCYQPDENTLTFKKKGDEKIIEIKIKDENDDFLHPCVLLYYPNDEVRILNPEEIEEFF